MSQLSTASKDAQKHNVLIIVTAQSHHLRLLLPRANLCVSRWSTDKTSSLILPHWTPLWGAMPSTALHTPADPYVLIEGGGKVHISQRTLWIINNNNKWIPCTKHLLHGQHSAKRFPCLISEHSALGTMTVLISQRESCGLETSGNWLKWHS